MMGAAVAGDARFRSAHERTGSTHKEKLMYFDVPGACE